MFTQTYNFEKNWKQNLELQEIQLQIYMKRLNLEITKKTNEFEKKKNNQQLQLLRK